MPFLTGTMVHVHGSEIALACTGSLSSLPCDVNDIAWIELLLGHVSVNS